MKPAAKRQKTKHSHAENLARYQEKVRAIKDAVTRQIAKKGAE